jgi:hypothetical protein
MSSGTDWNTKEQTMPDAELLEVLSLICISLDEIKQNPQFSENERGLVARLSIIQFILEAEAEKRGLDVSECKP